MTSEEIIKAAAHYACLEFYQLPVCIKMYIYFMARDKRRFKNLDFSNVVREISHLPANCLEIFRNYIKHEPKEDKHCHYFSWEHEYVILEKALNLIT